MTNIRMVILLLNAGLSVFPVYVLMDFFAGGTIADQQGDNELFYLIMWLWGLSFPVVLYALWKRTEFWYIFGIIACWSFPGFGLMLGFMFSLTRQFYGWP